MKAEDRYDELYQQGEEILKTHNPCQFHTDDQGRVRCAGGTPCCGGCPHLTPTGCSVKSLACKLWLCYETTKYDHSGKKPTPVYISLEVLRKTALKEGIPMGMRYSKEQNFRGRC